MSGRWLLDLGNTRLKCAPLRDDGSVGEMVAVAYRDSTLAEVLSLARIDGDVAYVSSVAAAATTLDLLEALTRRFTRLSIARTQSVFGEMRIAYGDPSALGVDRFLAMLGARARHREAVLVVGIGTALTIDLVDDGGGHRGGRIAPSPTLMREALHGRAVQLPASGGVYAEFAADTVSALSSGCEGAAVGLIERSVLAAASALGAPPAILLHGGGAEAMLPHFPRATLVPALVLEGLALWAAIERLE